MTSISDNRNLDELTGMSSEQNPQRESMEREDSIEIADSGEAADSIDLEEATLDPAALIESQQVYSQAEAIDAAMTDLVDAAQEEASEGGKRAFGQETGDPSQHYSGVQMAQGEVVTDQDWNDDPNAPATEEWAGDREGRDTSLEKGDRPLEVVPDGEFLGFVGKIEGSTTKAEIGLHDLGEPIIEKKDVTPGSAGEISMDGQGGDILADLGGRFDVEEGVIPRREDSGLRADPSEATDPDDE